MEFDSVVIGLLLGLLLPYVLPKVGSWLKNRKKGKAEA